MADGRTSLLFHMFARDDVTPAMRKTSAEIFKIDNAMRGSARRMVSRVLLIGAALASVAGHAVALTAAIWPLVGALGAIPAITVGGIAGIAGLITGFSGLGKAMKQTGGGAGNAAQQIEAAQRRMERANRSLRDSQEALNDAFESARDNLRDIQTSYAGAQLDVEGAALAVRDAELALREARRSGDRQERLRADLALRQARLNQVEATNRLSDVEQEYNERMAKGVAGSDEVRDATERQADALYELAEAQKALDEAMRGGGGGGGENAYAKLTQSGRDLVDTLRRLGPEWRKVQQATQEALFAGVAGDVQQLSDRWFPVMLRQLPNITLGWNNMFRSMMQVASTQGFVDDMDDSLGLMGTMWQRVGRAFGPFLNGFRHWVAVGSQFLPRLGSWVERLAGRFELWSMRVRQTGEAFNWIENAVQTGAKLNELVKSWGRSIFEVFRLGQDKTLLDRLIEGSEAFERWLATAEGQERITRMWERMRDLGTQAWRAVKEVIDILSQFDFSALAGVIGVLADALGFVADNMRFINAVVGPLIHAFVLYKVATIALNLAKKTLIGTSKLFGAQLMAETAATERDTAAKGRNAAASARLSGAFGRIERALGPLALAWIGLDLVGTLWLDKLLGINRETSAALIPTERLADGTLMTAEAFDAARSAMDDYHSSLRAQTDPLFAFSRAQERVNSAQERINDLQRRGLEGSPEFIQAQWDLAEAEQALILATDKLATVNGPATLDMLKKWHEQGLISKETFDLLSASINAIPENTQKTIRVSYDMNVTANLSPDARLALSRSFGSDLHLFNMAGRAEGGPVRAGRPYVVGEEGPEVFVPDASGTIVPNGAGGGGAAVGGEHRFVFDFRGAESELVRAIVNVLRKAVRTQGRGNAQVFFAGA